MNIIAFLVLLVLGVLFLETELVFLGWLCLIAGLLYLVLGLVSGTGKVAAKGGRALYKAGQAEVQEIEETPAKSVGPSAREAVKGASKQLGGIFGGERSVPPAVGDAATPPMDFKYPEPTDSATPPERENFIIQLGDGCKSLLDAFFRLFK